MTDKIRISSEIAETLYEVDNGEECGGYTKVDDIRKSEGRWQHWNWLIMSDVDGNYYGIEYGMGLTENQDNSLPWKGWGGTPETVEAFRVYPKPVAHIEWKQWEK